MYRRKRAGGVVALGCIYLRTSLNRLSADATVTNLSHLACILILVLRRATTRKSLRPTLQVGTPHGEVLHELVCCESFQRTQVAVG